MSIAKIRTDYAMKKFVPFCTVLIRTPSVYRSQHPTLGKVLLAFKIWGTHVL